MQKILILNGSHSEIPLIRAARQLGLHVITTGNAPHLVGHRLANEYQPADFMDAQAVLELAWRQKVDYVCSCANDGGIVTAAFVAESLDLPGHDPSTTTLLLHHKNRFKQYSRTRDVPTPLARDFDAIESAWAARTELRYPVIVKPVDMAGGKGVSRVDDESQYRQALQVAFAASPSSSVVVEDFIEGTQHSFSTFLVDQRVVAHFSDDEYSTINPYTVSTSAAPATGIEQVRDELVRVSEAMAQDLGLVNGVFHHQYILNGGRPHILEITRRCSGDIYPGPVSYALGVDWAEWIVRAAMGQDCRDFPAVQQQGFCGRHCIMAERDGTLEGFDIHPSLRPHVFEEVYAVGPGASVTNHLSQKLAVLMLRYGSRAEMDAITPRLHELARARVV